MAQRKAVSFLGQPYVCCVCYIMQLWQSEQAQQGNQPELW